MRHVISGGLRFSAGKYAFSSKKRDFNIPATELPPPSRAVIPLWQHAGKPAIPVVSVGDSVKTGQLIGRAADGVSAKIHSSVSGSIWSITPCTNGRGIAQTITIDVERDEWDSAIDRSETFNRYCPFSAAEIRQKIADAGVVGLGGACFPTHLKISSAHKTELLIINGVECEPFLGCDYYLMQHHTEEIAFGITLLMKALNVERAIIGIKRNNSKLIALFQEVSKHYYGIQVEAVDIRYPSGNEKILIGALTGKHLTSGKLPVEEGVIVHNVATAFAVYQAVQKNRPLIDRIISLSGPLVKRPCNLKVRIGTPVTDLLTGENAWLRTADARFISSGTMTGRQITTLDEPVEKGTSAIIVLRKTATPTSQRCIKCGACIRVCPMGLSPCLLVHSAAQDMSEKLNEDSAKDCIFCGCCSYVCPSYIPLTETIRTLLK
ncbi:MAG: electron transport complex subunit RsxC [Prevotellaceae bacterium]|jgi:electron transport complex protein RnfC|nr:electron transport complex subunit RsxC [Prevotellaceae bacterium]